MGAAGSTADDWDAFTVQQQRAQFRLLQQQLQETRTGNLDARPLAAALAGQAPLVEQPTLRISRVFKNPAHLHGKTLTLRGRLGEALPPSVYFRFDASLPGTLSVHWSAHCITDARGRIVVQRAERSVVSPFQAGLGQERSVDWSCCAPAGSRGAPGAPGAGAGGACGRAADVERGVAEERVDEAFPVLWLLLVELRVDEDAPEVAGVGGEQPTLPSAQWTMCRVIDSPALPQCAVEVVGQTVACGEAPALDFTEVFGSECQQDGRTRQDCIVCQSEPRDTMVLPCRHMCLCFSCADYIRTRIQYTSYKCPICRKRISKMMREDREGPAGLTWDAPGGAGDAAVVDYDAPADAVAAGGP